MEKSLDFYCNVLGLSRAFVLSNDKGEPWIHYLKAAEGQFVELFYVSAYEPPFETDKLSCHHICLEVDDIEAVCGHIRDLGYPIDTAPMQGSDLNRQAWLRDPDGNRIELMQMHPDSPQKNC